MKLGSHKNISVDVWSGFINNCFKLSLSWGMGKQTGVPLYSGILVIHQEEQITITLGNTGGSQKHYCSVKEARLRTLRYI